MPFCCEMHSGQISHIRTIKARTMSEETSGNVVLGENCLTKELIVSSGKYISYQRHSHRTEIWIFVKGEGRLILDGVARQVKRGDVAYIKPGVKHAIIADTQLHFIEVQVGDELTEEDIERFEWEW